MLVKDYVDDVLSVPVTRIGNKYIVEAIELVLDTKEHKFYKQLSDIIGKSPEYLEKAMRDAKNFGLSYMDKDLKEKIFNGSDAVTTTEYILKAAKYYRRTYEDKES